MLSALVVAALASALLLLLALPVQAVTPGENGKIVFSNNSQILTMNSDGSGPARLTTKDGEGQVYDQDPVWSPDGTKIAFTRGFRDDAGVYIMNADGTGQESLTPGSESRDPSFSPDGTKIAFSTSRDNNNVDWWKRKYEIYTMDIDGSDQKRLTKSEPVSERAPVFSPDGTKIAFAANQEGKYGIYTMNVDGSDQVQLTSNPEVDRDPVWSPDGEKIAFSSEGEYYDFGSHNTGNYEAIYIMDADGSDRQRLSPEDTFEGEPTAESEPSWSPDGTKIVFKKYAFDYDNGPSEHLYTMNSDGLGSTKKLTVGGGYSGDPDWGSLPDSPDNTSPDTNIDSGPRGIVKSTTASFKYSSSEPFSTFECSLDGGSFSECGFSPGDNDYKYYRDLSQGEHTFEVRAIDKAGNVDATVAKRSWVVDSTPPDTTIDSGLQGIVNSTTASFEYSSSESLSTFECSLDSASFNYCGSSQNDRGGKSYNDLSQGKHTFKVRAIDEAGNVDPTPPDMSWVVDTSKPRIGSVKPAPGARIRDRTPTIRAVVRDRWSDLSKDNIRLYVDGRKITTFRYNRATDRLKFTSRRGLGRHRVKIVARDSVDHTAYKSWSFRIRR